MPVHRARHAGVIEMSLADVAMELGDVALGAFVVDAAHLPRVTFRAAPHVDLPAILQVRGGRVAKETGRQRRHVKTVVERLRDVRPKRAVLELEHRGGHIGAVAVRLRAVGAGAAAGGDGPFAQQPDHGINDVDVVGDDRVAAQVGVRQPDLAAQPALEVLLQRRVRPGLPGHAEGGDVAEPAQRAIAHAPPHLEHRGVARQLIVDEETELFLRRQAARLADEQGAGHVHRDRLGHVDMLAGVHRGAGLLGVEIRDVLDHHGLDAAVEQPLVAVQSGEPARRVHLQRLAGFPGHLGEVVGDGVKLIAAVFVEQVGQPQAASAAADEADFDLARRRRRGLHRADGQRAERGAEKQTSGQWHAGLLMFSSPSDRPRASCFPCMRHGQLLQARARGPRLASVDFMMPTSGSIS